MGASAGALVGSLLVPGFGSLGSVAGGISSGGEPVLLLQPAGVGHLSHLRTYLYLRLPVWLPATCLAILGCPQCLCLPLVVAASGSALAPLEKVTVAMPLGCCALLPHAVCLVLIPCN